MERVDQKFNPTKNIELRQYMTKCVCVFVCVCVCVCVCVYMLIILPVLSNTTRSQRVSILKMSMVMPILLTNLLLKSKKKQVGHVAFAFFCHYTLIWWPRDRVFGRLTQLWANFSIFALLKESLNFFFFKRKKYCFCLQKY